MLGGCSTFVCCLSTVYDSMICWASRKVQYNLVRETIQWDIIYGVGFVDKYICYTLCVERMRKKN